MKRGNSIEEGASGDEQGLNNLRTTEASLSNLGTGFYQEENLHAHVRLQLDKPDRAKGYLSDAQH